MSGVRSNIRLLGFLNLRTISWSIRARMGAVRTLSLSRILACSSVSSAFERVFERIILTWASLDFSSEEDVYNPFYKRRKYIMQSQVLSILINMPTHSKPYIQLFENSDILIYSLKELQINSCAWSWEDHHIKMVFMGTPSYKRLNLQSYLPTSKNKK